MLWSNAPKFCLLCSNYAPYVSQYAPQIQHFLSLILFISQNHEHQQSLFKSVRIPCVTWCLSGKHYNHNSLILPLFSWLIQLHTDNQADSPTTVFPRLIPYPRLVPQCGTIQIQTTLKW